MGHSLYILQLIAHTDVDIKPVYLTVSHNESRFLVASKGNFVLLEANEKTSSDKINAPFDIASGFFTQDDSLVYVREGTGSEVAVIDFSLQKVLGESGTGRASVKFGQFLATVAIGAATGYYTGYVNTFYRMSDTAMVLSRDEQRLYVVNAKTNDVTLLNSKDLSGRKGIATGSGTFGVFQLLQEQYPESSDSNVFVISPSSVSYFNASSDEMVNQVSFKGFINFDADENLLFGQDEYGNVNVYKLSNGKHVGMIDKSEKIIQISYYSN